MATVISTMSVKMDLDPSGFNRAMDNVGKKLGDTGAKLRGLGTQLTGAMTVPIVGAFGVAVMAASDLNETLNKTTVVFDDAAAGVIAWSEDSATAFGLSQNEALGMAATFGNIFTGMGMTGEAAAAMSKDIVGLGADLGSFNNVPTAEALEAIRAGLLGEYEPLRRFGIVLDAAAVEAKALEMGLVDANGEVTEAGKVAARQALITEGAANAQGDFAETSGSLANQMKILRARLTNAAAGIGQILLPVVTAAIGFIASLAEKFGKLGGTAKTIIVVIGSIAAAIGPLLMAIGFLSSSLGGVLVALGPLGLTFGGLILPIVAIIALVSALALAWKRNLGGIASTTKYVVSFIGKLFKVIGPIINVIKALFGLGDMSLGKSLIKLGTAMRLVGFNEDQIKQVREFLKGLQPIADKAKSVLSALRDAFVWFTEASLASLIAMIGPVGRVIGVVIDLIGRLVGKLGGVVALIASNRETIEGFARTLGGVFRQAGELVGRALNVVRGIVARAVDAVVGLWDRLGSRVQTVIKVVAGVMAAIGPIVSVVTSVVGFIAGVIAPVIGLIGSVIGAVTGAAGAIGAVLAFVLSPIGLIIAAIALLAIAYKTNFLGFGDAVRRVAKWIKGLDFAGWAKSAMAALKKLWEMLKGPATTAINIFRTMLAKLVDGVKLMVTKVKENIAPLKSAFGGIVEMVKGVVDLVSALFRGDWAAALDAARDILDGYIQYLTGIFGFLLNMLKEIDWGALVSGAADLGVKLLSYIDDLGLLLWGWAKAGATYLAGEIGKLWDEHGDTIKATAAKFVGYIDDVGLLLWDWLKKGARYVATVITGLWDEHGETIKQLPGRFVTAMGALGRNLWTWIKTGATYLATELPKLWNEYKDDIGLLGWYLVQRAKTTGPLLWEWVKDGARYVAGLLVVLWDRYKDDIAKLSGLFVDLMTGLGAKLWDWAKKGAKWMAGKITALWDDHKVTIAQLPGRFVAGMTLLGLKFWEWAKTGASYLMTKITGLWDAHGETLKQLPGRLISGIGSLGGQLYEWVKKGASDAATSVGTAGSDVLNSMSTIGTRMGGALKNAFNGALSSIGGFLKEELNGIIDWINGWIRSVNDKIPGNPIPYIPRIGGGQPADGGGGATGGGPNAQGFDSGIGGAQTINATITINVTGVTNPKDVANMTYQVLSNELGLKGAV